MYKKLIKLNSKTKTKQQQNQTPQITKFKNGQSTWTDIFPKKAYKCSTGTCGWNDVDERY